jgi:PleD family two-component response regulator
MQKAGPESSQEKQVGIMQSQCYQVLIIGEGPSQAQAYVQMLHDVEGASFDVKTETNWQSALQRFVSGAPDLSLPDAILWELPASGEVALAALKNATSLQRCVPFLLLVRETQKQLAKQFLAGASEYLVLETLNKVLD